MLKKKLFLRTLITFSIVVFLYSGILMWMGINRHYERLTYENKMLNEQFLEKTSLLIDNRLEVMLTYISFLAEKESVRSYLMGQENQFASFSNLHDDIVNNLFSINQLGFTVGVAKDVNDYIVSSEGYFLFDDYIKHLNLEKDLYRIKNILSNKTTSKYEYLMNDKQSIMIIKQEQESTRKSVYYFIVFNNSVVLPSSLPNNQGGFAFGNEDDLLFQKESPGSDHVNLPKVMEGIDQVDTEKIASEMFYMKRSTVIPTLSYYYYNHEQKAITMLTRDSIRSLGLMLSSLIVLGIGIVIYSSRKNYQPIKKIMENFPLETNEQGEWDALADENELDFILDNIKKINTTNQELELEYSKSIYAMQEEFLKNVMFGATDQIETQVVDLQLAAFKEGGTLVVLSLEGISELEANLSEFNVLILRKRIIQTYKGANQEKIFIPVAMDYRHFCLFFVEKELAEVTQVLEELKTVLEKDSTVDITFTIANPIEHISSLPYAYNEALSLLELRYSFVETKIISIKSTAIANRDDYNYSIEAEQFFINLLKGKKYDEGMMYIVDLLNDVLIKKDLSPHSIIEFKYALINTIKRSLHYANKSFSEFSKTYRRLFEKVTSNEPKELEDSFVSIFSYLIQEIEIVNKGEAKTTPERIVEFLEANYQVDIALTDVATSFNLSESYVSRVIKEATGMSFKNYVNGLKVVKGKELLSTGKYKVNEVSELVGCNNVNTFIRIFKQIEGRSPGQYMREINQW